MNSTLQALNIPTFSMITFHPLSFSPFKGFAFYTTRLHVLCACFISLTCRFRIPGELYRGRDQGDDGQEAEHPQHVRNRPRGSRQVDFDRLARVQSWNYCGSQGRRDQVHRYTQG